MAVPDRRVIVTFIVINCLLGFPSRVNAAQYLGKFLGKLTELHHGVSGEVYAVDARTLHIKDFTYDGQGPAAYFFAGNSRAPGNTGFRIRDENGNPGVLRRYRKEGVTITLPEGKSLNNIKWFSVWCEEFEVNFGDVKIPKNFDYPRPLKVDGLRGIHGVSSDNIVIVDAQTLLIPNLSYDGEAPDAKFWVGRGLKPTPQGIRVPDENGKEIPLRRYDRKTVVLTLPGDLTLFDIGHFGIWCEAFTVDFGHVQIPQNPNVPPSLKMLGVSPQSKLNCEVLHDDLAFEVRWAIAGDSIVLQLVAKLENGEYMSFGISGEESNSVMIGGDVVVAWVDKETLKGFADDYNLGAKSQCSGPKGSCPDNNLADNTNSIRLLNAAMVNGYSIVTYQRPLKASDEFDKPIVTNASQPIIWAIGPLNQRNEVSFHSLYNKINKFIDFGRPAKWNCPMPEGDQPPMKQVASKTEDVQEEAEAETQKPTRNRNNERRRGGSANKQEVKDSEKSASRTRPSERRDNTRTTQRPIATPAPVKNRNAWDIPAIQCHEPEDGVFYAQMGPTGGKRGYPAITGHVGWGISWYINGLLIPEINVVRGKTYTFVVEGGFDPEVPAKYHPFYITDDPIGGFEYKTSEEKQSVKIFAGAEQNSSGSIRPIGVGRLCHWTHQGETDADDFESFGAYQRTLELKCDQGEPGVIQWTPDKDTPDTVYYQCFTHRYLGWKINVLDSCDYDGAESEIHEEIVEPDNIVEDLDDSPSIRVETRINPNNLMGSTSMGARNGLGVNLQEEEVNKNLTSKGDLETILNVQELPKIHIGNWTFKNGEELDMIKIKPKIPHITNMHHMVKHPLRRPLGRPPMMVNHHVKYISMNRHAPQIMYKKPFTQYPLKSIKVPKPPSAPVINRHIKTEKPSHVLHRPHPIINMKPYPKPNIPMLPQIHHQTTPILNIEVSPQQLSTEKPILAQTEINRVAEETRIYETYENLKPAVNTGFHPESVVVESGFKPIIYKEENIRRSDDNQPELDFESQRGVLDETQDTTSSPENPIEIFEPIFIPSPTLNVNSKKYQFKLKKPVKRIILKRAKSYDIDIIPSANEPAVSYYLPPENNKTKLKQKDTAPDTVITFDGKKISGASLTPRAGDLRSILDQRATKATEFIKSQPQFVQYEGELPPLNPLVVDYNAPQLHNINRPPALSRTIKLKQVGESQRDTKERQKRSAHHTEEHTAEQLREKEEQEKAAKSSGNTFEMLSSPIIMCVVLIFRL